MNSTAIGSATYPLPRSNRFVASRDVAREPPLENAAPGLRKLGNPRPNHAHAVLTYGISTLQGTRGVGAHVDIYV